MKSSTIYNYIRNWYVKYDRQEMQSIELFILNINMKGKREKVEDTTQFIEAPIVMNKSVIILHNKDDCWLN